MTDAFAEKAAAWDQNPVRVAGARAFFDAVLPLAGPAAKGLVLDFGSGTGLLGLLFADIARRVDLVDTSPAMVQVLRGKIAAQGLANVAVHLGEIAELTGLALPEASFDLVVSLNALHHIPVIPPVLAQLYRLCAPGGHIIVADLMSEDGSFHGAEAAVHKGFDPAELARQFQAAGFEVQGTLQHHTIIKADASGAQRHYPQFLLHARKP
ncbi:MAG: SAM-dependent methyltransferase [Deltaproteobacteria bacterium HGW-Deltaproteobacteria-8]|jgi:SAM-dependent methyltransferase|nr:MAG: SAM-dependent methyltransferase [Deltaproteobacteria bacterium HGW-Deltaproteobacteria-8]